MKRITIISAFAILLAIPSLSQQGKDSVYINQLRPALEKAVPEIKQWEMDYDSLTNGKYKLIVYIQKLPDSTSSNFRDKNYFSIYVAHESQFTNNTFERFMIHKDTKEVLWYCLPKDSCYSLKDWREKKY
jgi:hypothetical protein